MLAERITCNSFLQHNTIVSLHPILQISLFPDVYTVSSLSDGKSNSNCSQYKRSHCLVWLICMCLFNHAISMYLFSDMCAAASASGVITKDTQYKGWHYLARSMNLWCVCVLYGASATLKLIFVIHFLVQGITQTVIAELCSFVMQ